MDNGERETFFAVSQFLYEEAALLEAQRFREWLDLLAEDIQYVMPVQNTVQGDLPAPAAAEGLRFHLYDDDKASLRMRVERLETGMARAETPPSVTQRLITNIRVRPEQSGSLWVDSRFLVQQWRPEGPTSIFIGQRQDRVREVKSGFLIAERTILLADPLLPRTVSIFF